MGLPTFAESRQDSFQRWVDTLRIRALEQGVSRETLDKHLRTLSFDTRVRRNSSNQAEFTTPFPEYRNYFVTDRMIQKGKALKEKHQSTLRKLEETYGVPAEILLAIWGIESRYGDQRSRFNAISALASMAYSSTSRANYFTGELLAVLKMLDRDQIRSENLHSSWAGALGQPQFMPTSYQTYAVDFDGDSYRDIWGSPSDVLASVANYLDKNGWNSEQTWGQQLSGDEPVSDSTVFSPEGTELRYRRTHNFSVLLKYNQSKFYALAVGLLSDRIGGLKQIE
ncbi:MAG: lytic transglycosylase domain-containing protein [bacterium]